MPSPKHLFERVFFPGSARSIVLALANPNPEIMPEDAYEGGAAIVGTGRSDLPNQVNNVLGFPGIFRGALDARAPRITARAVVKDRRPPQAANASSRSSLTASTA